MKYLSFSKALLALSFIFGAHLYANDGSDTCGEEDLSQELEIVDCQPRTTPLGFNLTSWQVKHDLFVIHSIPKCGTHFIEGIIPLMLDKKVIHRQLSVANLQEACNNNSVLRIFQEYTPDGRALIRHQGHKLVAMIRDPRDALVSHTMYMRSFGEKPNPSNKRDFFTVGDDFDTIPFNQQMYSLMVGNKYADSYLDYYRERMKWALSSGSLIMRYEDLVGKQGGGDDQLQRQAILKLAKYIHADIPKAKINHVIENMYRGGGEREANGMTYVKGTIGNWKNFFTPRHKKVFKELFGKELIQLGYEKDMNW